MAGPTTPKFFNGHDFLVDLERELGKRGHPCYPAQRWWWAYEEAENRDFARKVRFLNDQLELTRREIVVDYIEDPDEAGRLVMVGYQIVVEASAAGFAASFDYEKSKRRDLLSKRAYYYANRRRVLDGKLAWQKRNVEKVRAYARAYQERKREERRQEAAGVTSRRN